MRGPAEAQNPALHIDYVAVLSVGSCTLSQGGRLGRLGGRELRAEAGAAGRPCGDRGAATGGGGGAGGGQVCGRGRGRGRAGVQGARPRTAAGGQMFGVFKSVPDRIHNIVQEILDI